jgi:hypothetical protein
MSWEFIGIGYDSNKKTVTAHRFWVGIAVLLITIAIFYVSCSGGAPAP